MVAQSKYPTAYWGEWAHVIIQALDLREKAKGEFHGACPSCGTNTPKEPDRFWISELNGEVKVHCRQCNGFSEIQERLRDMGLWPQINERPYDPNNNVTPFKPAQDMSDTTQPYHIKKGINLYNARCVDGVVEYDIYDSDGQVIGKQRIHPDGSKRFTKGMEKEGAFGHVGGPLDGKVYITEGYADACSVHESTGRPVIVGLDANNVPKVVKAIKERLPSVTLILAADNDKAGLKAIEQSGIPAITPEQDGWDFNDLHQAFGTEAVLDRLNLAKIPKPLWSRIGELELREAEWLIDGMLEKHALVCGFGAPAAGKTFVMVDVALSVATGKKYHGMDVDQGTVFYIAGEGHNGFVRRCLAWSKFNDTDIKDAPFFKSNRAIVMNDEKAVEVMFATIEQLSEQFGKPKLVVIDTLARSMGGDENSTKDMNTFVQAVDRIKDEYSCTVLVAHHTGHGTKERGRGSSAWLGALDAEFSVTKVGENDTHVKFTKMKDAKEPEPMAFIKHDVELMTTTLKPVSSIALEKVPFAERQASTPDEIVTEAIKEIVDLTGDKWVQQAALKLEISVSKGVTQKTVHNWIAGMVAGNKLDKKIDDKNQSKQWVALP